MIFLLLSGAQIEMDRWTMDIDFFFVLYLMLLKLFIILSHYLVWCFVVGWICFFLSCGYLHLPTFYHLTCFLHFSCFTLIDCYSYLFSSSHSTRT
jgi:hypothetical protein